MPLITFESIELPTTEDIAYVKEAIKVANLNVKEFIAIVLPVIVLELTNTISLDLLAKFLEEYYVKNEEEFIETSITLIDYEEICQLIMDKIFIKEYSAEVLTTDNANE
jgi:hypothetical protein